MIILNFNELDSTNKYLIKEHNNVPDFTFVSAKFQNAGKGREGRVWYSNYGENILASFLVKNSKFTSKFHLFSICTAVSIMKILKEIGVKNVLIKWPNDVYVNNKKICGVLLQGNLPDFFVVGFGINVNQISFEDEYRTTPTSVALELRKKQNIDKLKKKIFADLEKMPKKLEEYIKLAQETDYLKGKIIKVDNETYECLGISNDAELICKNDNGISLFRSGEVCIMK